MPCTINASTSAGLVSTASTDGSLALQTNSGVTALTIDTSQNVGIGTSSPNIGGANSSNEIVTIVGKASTRNGIIELGNYGTTGNDQTLGWTRYFDSTTENAAIEVARASSTSTAYMKFSTNGGSGNTERMRIDSSGNLLVGNTSSSASPASGFIAYIGGGSSGMAIGHVNGTSSGNYYASFAYNSGVIGSITQNGTTNVAYNTSSDYRLKENIQPMQNALATIAQLNPVTYKWKSDGSDGQGFIAHELQAVVPDCVTGEKDAVDADGNPVYQGIDTSFLVATLTAALQEQQALIQTLQTQVAQLQAKVGV
jgi:hypothetical protein